MAVENESDGQESIQESTIQIPEGASSFLDTEGVSAEVSDSDGVVVERPEYINEAHWDPKIGEVRVEALAKSFTDTKAALDKKKDDSGVPENALGYFTTKDDGSLFTPEGLDFLPDIDPSDVVLKAVSEAALENNVSQVQMDAIVGAYLKGQNTYFSQYEFNPEVEMAKIDADPVKAGYMVEGVRTYLSQLDLSDSQASMLNSVMSSGDGVLVMSKIMKLAGVKAIPVGAQVSTTPDTSVLRERWDVLRKDPASRDNNPAFQAEFEQIGSQLFG